MTPLPEFIPIVSPISVGEQKTSGRTRPFQMRCETTVGYADYIVKLWANPEVHLAKHSLARELYGSLLARVFDLDTPDVALVDIEPDFFHSIPSSPNAELFRQSVGYNFGSKFIPGATIFSPPVAPARHSLAVKIFCFDMLIGNPDRRMAKPNVFQSADGFIIFDHEQAFPFSRPQMLLGGYPPGWEFIREDWHKDHIFHKSIKNRDYALEIEEFMTFVGCLSNEVFDTIEEQIPEAWRSSGDLQNIRLYLANTRDNLNKFKRSLQEILV